MSTTNNVFLPNVPRGSSGPDQWPHLYALHRALKKAGWKVLASSDGSAKLVSDDPELDKWGAGTTTGVTGSAASTGTIIGGRMTVSGLSGIVAADKGRFLHLDGASSAGNNHYHQIEEVISATEVRVDARRSAFTPVASDANNGSINWEIFDPTTEAETQGTGTKGWILLSGPSMVKIPITVEPTGVFLRGENVSQATTGAEGEIRGWVFDGSSAGWIVIDPRKRGSGGEVYGWGTSNAITGSDSSATVPQNGTATAWTQQVMIMKSDDLEHGHFYVQCIDKANESAEDFETLASAAGCTATIGPGQGGTGNGFPLKAYTLNGVGGGTAEVNWNGANATMDVGNGQIIAMDAIEEEDYTASGSFLCVASSVTETQGLGMFGYMLCICDDGEPGDLDPYVGHGGSGEVDWSSSYSGARTGSVQISTSAISGDRFTSETLDNSMSTTIVAFKGWRNRGLSTGDQFVVIEVAFPWAGQSYNFLHEVTPGDSLKYSTDPSPTPPLVRLPLYAVAARYANQKTFKGAFRHLTQIGGGMRCDTYDGGKHIQIGTQPGSIVWTPWDETTTPLPA
jgi:hypothetical protein